MQFFDARCSICTRNRPYTSGYPLNEPKPFYGTVATREQAMARFKECWERKSRTQEPVTRHQVERLKGHARVSTRSRETRHKPVIRRIEFHALCLYSSARDPITGAQMTIRNLFSDLAAETGFLVRAFVIRNSVVLIGLTTVALAALAR